MDWNLRKSCSHIQQVDDNLTGWAHQLHFANPRHTGSRDAKKQFHGEKPAKRQNLWYY